MKAARNMISPSDGNTVDSLAPLPPSGRITDVVYDTLRDAIFSGALSPGSKLSVPALADRLNVSRSPVREAVLRLTQDRLAFEEPRRGVMVASIGAAELAELYEVREALEGVATRLATQRDGSQLTQELTTVLEEHTAAVAAGDVKGHTELDMRFHSLIRKASGNQHVLRMLDEIQAQVRLAMLTTTVTAGPRRAVDDHRAILNAIASGDPARAEAAARQHIARLAATLRGQAGAHD